MSSSPSSAPRPSIGESSTRDRRMRKIRATRSIEGRKGRSWQSVSGLRHISLVKVFSATKARDRSELGERVTSWIASHPQVDIVRADVLLSSDRQFHCLSIVLLGHEKP